MCFFAPGAPGGAKRGQTGDLPGGVRTFLDGALARSPRGYRLYARRADSGFFEAAVFSALERRELPIAVIVSRRARLDVSSGARWPALQAPRLASNIDERPKPYLHEWPRQGGGPMLSTTFTVIDCVGSTLPATSVDRN